MIEEYCVKEYNLVLDRHAQRSVLLFFKDDDKRKYSFKFINS